MIIGTFNGWNIVAMPPGPPVARSQQFTAVDTVASTISPFTGQMQMIDWQAGWIELQIELPPLTHLQAQPWIAFLMQLRGSMNCFQIGDSLAVAPLGSHAGTPLVNGANQTGYSLLTKGWTASAANVLLPGDWIQIGFRLYRNLDPASADSSGHATLNIWPRLRESPADGDPLILTNTQGLFRLAKNQRQWSLNVNGTYGLQFDAREAI